MSERRFTVPVPGGKLCGDVRGEGPAVVLLHGFTLDRRVFDAVAPPLAARGLTVVRVDLRGHGESPDAGAPYAAADEVPRLLDALGLARAALVGQSWGGQLALDTALEHPARVRALALVDAALPGHDWSPAWREQGARLRALAQGPEGPRAAAHAWYGSPLFAPARAHAAARALLAAWETARAGRAFAARDPALPAQPLAARRLGELRLPTLVVAGEQDLDDFRAIARALAEGIAGARTVELKGVGHLASLEAPDELARVLGDFLVETARA